MKIGHSMDTFMVPSLNMLLISYGFTVVSPFGYYFIPIAPLNIKISDSKISAIYLFVVAKSSRHICKIKNYGCFFRKGANVHNWPKKVFIFMNVSIKTHSLSNHFSYLTIYILSHLKWYITTSRISPYFVSYNIFYLTISYISTSRTALDIIY